VGFIFQTFNLLPVLSALENVLLPLRIKGESLATARDKAKKRLTELGLVEHAHHRKLTAARRNGKKIAASLIC
jgi:putative ABC transport system ATP-binding protein